MLPSSEEVNSLSLNNSLVGKPVLGYRQLANQARALNSKIGSSRTNGGATIKLNKILLHHVQNPNIGKIENAKLPRFDNESSSQSLNTNKSGRISSQRPSVLESPSSFGSNQSNPMYRLPNPLIKRDLKKPNARSLSNGHLRPIQKTPENDSTFVRFTQTPQIYRIERNFTSVKTRISILGNDPETLSTDERAERGTKIPTTLTRFNKRFVRQKSLSELQQEARKIETENIMMFERKTGRHHKLSFSEESYIPPLKTNEDLRYRSLIFSPNLSDIVVRRHLKSVIEGLDYAINHLKAPSLAFVESRQVLLEKPNNKFSKTLILDLDETLMTSCSLEEKPDLILTPSENMKLMIKIRPFAQQFLNIMKEHFEIVVFTASSELYAKTVVSALDPKMECISYIFHRGFCFETSKGLRIKDLRILKNRDLKDMIMVDNFVPAFSFQLENGIPILEWKGDKQDKELMYIVDYLLKAKEYDDMREYNREKLALIRLAKENAFEEAIF